jgi:N-acetylglutamate synthase-like GNAT family acetyltransferase
MKNKSVSIREAVPSNMNELFTIDERLFIEWKIDKSLYQKKLKRYFTSSSIFYVAEINGHIIGYIFGRIYTDSYDGRYFGLIEILFTLEDYKNEHIKPLLLTCFENKARLLGAATVVINHAKSARFFESCGYVVIEHRHVKFLDNETLELYPVKPSKVTVSGWNIVNIIKSNQRMNKFLGYWVEGGSSRLSSEILTYDLESGTGSTISGSQYCFLGQPGKLHPLAQTILDQLKITKDLKVSLVFPDDQKL